MCCYMVRVGQNHIHTRCIYGIFGREIAKHTVIYGVFIRFWPTLFMVRTCIIVTMRVVMSALLFLPYLFGSTEEEKEICSQWTTLFRLVKEKKRLRPFVCQDESWYQLKHGLQV